MTYQDDWPWPKWKDAPAWAMFVTQDADGKIGWWRLKPNTDPEVSGWVSEPYNDVILAMRGHPNSYWAFAIETREEGIEREREESRKETNDRYRFSPENLPPWRDLGTKGDGPDIGETVDRMSRLKASAQEARIYAALIDMGWTPPSGDKAKGETE